MRILVDSGCYDLCNMGDVAMLQVAVERLHNMWPTALVEVITNRPAILSRLCPKAYAVCGDGRHIWFHDRNILGRIHKLMPEKMEQNLKELEQVSRRFYPTLYTSLVQFKLKIRRKNNAAMRDFLDAFMNTDLLVISGCGAINDHFTDFASTTLELLEIAKRRGIPTAMFGQGIGPIENVRLLKKAKAILPTVGLIAIREKDTSLNLLESLGVDQNKILVTGDDAIEPAYNMKAEKQGRCIGVNLRMASYSQVTAEHIDVLTSVLQKSAAKHSSHITAIPISFYENEADSKIIQQITGAYSNSSSINSPEDVIEQVTQCRLVVTGSYHSAVFALSQGIPAITLYKTVYYKNKFLGLANQFGCGCETISLDDNNFAWKLKDNIDYYWQNAETLRPKLLAAAESQIESSRDAYKKLYLMIESHRTAKKGQMQYV